MVVDLDKIRAMYEEMQAPKGGGGNFDLGNFFKINEGANIVRILPAKEGTDDDFYTMTKFHRIKGAGQEGRDLQVHCRTLHDEKCPLCDLYFSIWNHINKTNDTQFKDFANYLRAKDRYYMNVIDRESTEVKILSMGKILFGKIIGSMVDPDFGDITDLEDGNDFKIVKVMDGSWPKYDQSAPRPKKTASGTKKEVKVWMDELHNLNEMVRLEDFDALDKIAKTHDPLAARGRSSEEADTSTKEEEASDGEFQKGLKA